MTIFRHRRGDRYGRDFGQSAGLSIISALQDGRLSADPETKKVFVTGTDGKIIDAATGAAVASLPDGAAAVRLNNSLRRIVEAALGGLTLLSPIPPSGSPRRSRFSRPMTRPCCR